MIATVRSIAATVSTVAPHAEPSYVRAAASASYVLAAAEIDYRSPVIADIITDAKLILLAEDDVAALTEELRTDTQAALAETVTLADTPGWTFSVALADAFALNESLVVDDEVLVNVNNVATLSETLGVAISTSAQDNMLLSDELTVYTVIGGVSPMNLSAFNEVRFNE